MPKPCTVCTHLKRAEIDVLLARQACSPTAIGRQYGLHKDALIRHRERHLPSFLPAFTAQADGLVQPMLTAEYQRLYMHGLDNLARAEAGVLERVVHEDPETGERYVEHRPRVSTQDVARAIREARSTLDSLLRLTAGEREPDTAPQAGDAALGAAIRAQLEAVIARRGGPTEPAAIEGSADVIEAEVVADHPEPASAPTVASRIAEGTQGPSTGSTGRQPPPPHSPETQPHQISARGGLGNPTHLPEGTPDLSVDAEGDVVLSPEQITAAARAAGITPQSLMDFLRRKRLPRIQHPEWTGNPAATKEERAAEGYADIEVADHRYDTT